MFELYLIAGSLLLLVASGWLLRYVVIRIPEDYFVSEEPKPTDWRSRYPAVRWTLRVLKNIAGALLLLSGLMMLVTPGPGVVAMLVGLSLLDVPGKRRLQRRIVRVPAVLGAINRQRERNGRPPLRLDAHADNSSGRSDTWPNKSS